MTRLKCIECGYTTGAIRNDLKCPVCGGLLVAMLEGIPTRIDGEGVWVWGKYLAAGSASSKVTLGEGNTPLIKARRLGRKLGIKELILKDETRNPTGTFIDRGSATLASIAKHRGIRKLVVASTGDLGISISAYARRAGIKTKIFMPGKAQTSKVYKTAALADSLLITQTYEEALNRLRKYESTAGIMQVNPKNPYLIDGYRTIAYELLADAGPLVKEATVIVPVGDGALITALWTVFRDINYKVRFVGVRGCSDSPLIKDMYVKEPLLKDKIEEAISEANGEIIEICEEEAIEASVTLLRHEGIMAGPIGSSTIAALSKLRSSSDVVISIISGDSLGDAAVLRKIVDSIKGKKPQITGLGFTKSKILEILALKGPLHPYGTWKALKEEYSVKISLRVVYQHIRELNSLGYIETKGTVTEDNRVRKLYTITRKGLAFLR